MLLRNLIQLKNSASSLLHHFCKETKGYAIALTLVALPFIVGVAAFVIDASRIANLHSDLQHATDAMALAGARELDGRNDAIPRALAAIAATSDNEAWFGNGGGPNVNNNLGDKVKVEFSATNLAGSDVTVSFLGAIPASDDTKIGPGACATSGTAPNNSDCTVKGSGTTLSNNAKYVRVVARPKSVKTIFPLPGFGRDDVPVNAEAVATYTAAACDVTPIFVCNPFEGHPTKTFNEAYEDGDLYGREVTMVLSGQQSPGPGNFGFLRTNGNGGSILGEALGTGSPGVCYEQDGLDTEPGVTWGQVQSNLNTRFGIYGGSAGGNGQGAPKRDPRYRPDSNVRSGQVQNSQSCSKIQEEDSFLDAMALPANSTENALGGGRISADGTWDLQTYWDINHNPSFNMPLPAGNNNAAQREANYWAEIAAGTRTQYTLPVIPTTQPTGYTPSQPSRFDVYQYEKDTAVPNLVADQAPNGESGVPACFSDYNLSNYSGDRRMIFSAVLNCTALSANKDLNGAATDLPAEAFARMFITRPVLPSSESKEISLEFADVTGQGGGGTLENFLREEAELVR